MGVAGPYKFPRILLVAGLAWVFLGIYLLAWQGWSQRVAWHYGEDRGGDLKQHYAVALMLEEGNGDYLPLYHGFVFSEEITKIFNHDLYLQQKYLDRHNYRYSPLIAWLSWKLAAIPYDFWVRAWGALSLVLAGASFLILRRTEMPTGRGCSLFPEALFFLGFPPLLYAFSIYQNAPLTLFIASVSAWLLKTGRPWIAGLVFGSICYKPQLMPYIAGIMLLCGQWRFAVATGLSTAFWLGIGVLVCGVQSHLYWCDSLLEIIHGLQGDEMQTNMPWKGFVLTVFPPSLQAVGLLLANGLGICLLGALVYFVHRAPKHPDWQPHHILYLALFWWLLFTPHVKAYEMVLALPLMMVLIRVRPPRSGLALGALGLLYFSGFAVSACRFMGFSPGAPLVTIAGIMALAVFWLGSNQAKNKVASEGSARA